MAIGNPRLLSQTDQESWQKKNISLRLRALPMKPSSSWAIRTANWQGSTAASTERFYLKLFFDLINKEYERRMACGGDGAVSLLIVMKNILEAELK